MTIQEAYDFFESLAKGSSTKSEIKIYQKFSYMLDKLKNREFSKEEVQSIEAELDRLDLESNREKGIKYFRKALSNFEKYLKDEFSLTTAGYYTKLYGGLGLVFGLLFGVAILTNLERSLGISLGLIGGMVVGSIMGRSLEAKAAKEGRIL